MLELAMPDKNDFKKLMKLYKKSFPLAERKPLFIMKYMQNKDRLRFYAIKDENEFIGLVITIYDEETTLIDYLAIESDIRSKGYGSKAIELIRQNFNTNTVFLEIENINDKAKNNDERIRRKNFYIKNGLCETDIKAFVYGTDMQALTIKGEITFDEYILFMKKAYGRFLYRFVNPVEI